jgi:hypothetical protein
MAPSSSRLRFGEPISVRVERQRSLKVRVSSDGVLVMISFFKFVNASKQNSWSFKHSSTLISSMFDFRSLFKSLTLSNELDLIFSLIPFSLPLSLNFALNVKCLMFGRPIRV